MSRKKLDEMQLQRRNKIGNQTLMLLFYLLMIDVCLYGLGFKWLEYPVNVFIIMMASMVFYSIRIIWNNAYIGPASTDKRTGRKTVIYITAIAAVTAAVTLSFMVISHEKVQPATEGDNSATILFVASVTSIIIGIVTQVIAYLRNKKTED